MSPTPTPAGPRRPVPGFTLVEVLVALLAMSIMAGMAWRGMDGIVRTRDISQARVDQTLRLNTVIAQWEEDLRAVQDSGALPQALACDGATVRMTRRTPTGLQVVAWSLRPDVGGNSAWIRWAGPPVTTNTGLQESWIRSQQLQGTETGSLRTLAGLSQWQVYFYQGNAWANCQSTGNFTSTRNAVAPQQTASAASGSASSVTTFLPAQRQAMPTGVRLLLTFAPDSGIAGDLRRDLALGP